MVSGIALGRPGAHRHVAGDLGQDRGPDDVRAALPGEDGVEDVPALSGGAFVWLPRARTTQAQYSYLVATVIGSAIVPAMIANAFFMPSHLLSESGTPLAEVPEALADGAT